MIVYVYPADTYACGHYRLIWPAQALRAQGVDVRVIMPNRREGIGGDIDTRTGQLTDIRIPGDADVMVLQRVALDKMADAVSMIRAKGVAVVVDMDDDLTKIDPSNPAWWAMRTDGVGKMAHYNWRNAHQACLNATMVTVSTPALLKVYAPHGRGQVVENRIPAGYLDIWHQDSATMSWPGSVHSHPADLYAMGPAVARLMREGVPYRGVGPAEGLAKALGLAEDPPVTGSVDMDEWPLRLAEIGVGLAPLADTRFNDAKSWLKPLEMMACGAPFVASASPEYARLLKLAPQAGLLATKPQDWYRKIKSLVTNAQLRREMSAVGRAAATNMTIEGNAWRWAEVWQSAMVAQRNLNRTRV